MFIERLKKIFRYILSASLAVVLLWFSFRDVEWADFWESLKACRWEFIVLSMLAGTFAFFLRALRWRQLLLPIDPETSLITTFNGVNIGNISNFVFPRIGEFVRCGVITRRTTVTYDKVLGTVVLERGWELLVMLMMLAVVVVAGFRRFGTFFIDQIWMPMSRKFNMWWVMTIVLALTAGMLYLIWRYRESNAFCGKVWGIFRGLAQGFSSCLHMERKWMFFAYTAFIWLTYWFMSACTVWAAPFLSGLDLVDALFLSLAGGLGFAVPVPGGIGAFHFIISLALSTIYGVPMETGIIYATISHTSQAITQIFCGLCSYLYEAVVR
ncbi:MAG: flippase-like domain-containing protein [Bacteroidales bacterium]|nr:flippase-like domain-containing protein [Bacteroidales bacterium]